MEENVIVKTVKVGAKLQTHPRKIIIIIIIIKSGIETKTQGELVLLSKQKNVFWFNQKENQTKRSGRRSSDGNERTDAK